MTDASIHREVADARAVVCQTVREFGGHTLTLRVELTDTVPYAATDGYRLLINPSAWGRLRQQRDRVFLVAHEVGHAVLQHTARATSWRGARDALIAVACEHVVNNLLADLGLTHSGALKPICDRRYWRMSVEEVYRALLDDQPKEEPPSPDPTPGEGEGEGEGGEGEGEGQGGEDLAGDIRPLPPGVTPDDYAEHTLNVLGESVGRGLTPSTVLENIINVECVPPPDPRAALRALLSQATRPAGDDWCRPRRRNAQRDGAVILPGRGRERALSRVLVVCDSSGSVSSAEIATFVRFVAAVAREYRCVGVDVAYCDTRMVGPWPIAAEAANPHDAPRGGTSYREPLRYADETGYRAVVYYTDGECDDQHPTKARQLWIVCRKGARLEAPWARVITADQWR